MRHKRIHLQNTKAIISNYFQGKFLKEHKEYYDSFEKLLNTIVCGIFLDFLTKIIFMMIIHCLAECASGKTENEKLDFENN